MSRFSVNINSDNTILSGYQAVQEGYLSIVLCFNSERNLRVDRVEGVIEESAISASATPPKVWKRYVDDSFVIIKKNSVSTFQKPRWPTDALYELRKFSLRGSPDRLRHSKKKRRRKLK